MSEPTHGQCPTCGQVKPLRKDGTMTMHPGRGSSRVVHSPLDGPPPNCTGSGRPAYHGEVTA